MDKKNIPITKCELEWKFTDYSFQFSYPVFDSKKQYALIYMTDSNGFWRGCIYLCHLINGKFDKICYQDCWENEI
jgi:hypothetical protein